MLRYKFIIWDVCFLRFLYLLISLLIGWLLWLCLCYYYSSKLICTNFRLLESLDFTGTWVDKFFKKQYSNFYNKILSTICLRGNVVYASYLKSKRARWYREYFSALELHHRVRLRYPRVNDHPERQGDLMVLKAYNGATGEKGVIILHYTETLAKCAAIFDLKRLAQQYMIVLEPSWWGYQSVFFLLYQGLPTQILIESPYEPDYLFIEKIDNNFYPSHLGAGDWVDPDLFVDGKDCEKEFDIVMVGNWSKIKRHELLFKAVAKMHLRKAIRIALVGYPSHGRTKSDIMAEAQRYGLKDGVTIYEQISPSEVARVLRMSKANVLLSKGEGANRGIYEGLFAGNVIVLYKHNKGVNRRIINKSTGYLADDNDLHLVLEKAIKNYHQFDTAKWARSHTGYTIVAAKLNARLKEIALQAGERWSMDIAPKKNVPNNIYVSDRDRLKLEQEYQRLAQFLIN